MEQTFIKIIYIKLYLPTGKSGKLWKIATVVPIYKGGDQSAV